MKATAAFLLVVLAVLALSLQHRIPGRAGTPLPAAPNPSAPTPPALATTTTTPAFAPEDVFRRAFWRQPTKADQILHAERRETPDHAPGEIARWQWFVVVKPSPELLQTLRNPETFGLLPTRTPRLANSAEPAPAWFPDLATARGGELRQIPSGGLTTYYVATTNTLYATDTGQGFASALKPLVSR